MRKSGSKTVQALGWVALAVIAGLTFFYARTAIFWREHDGYDDTGYMIAILKGVSEGKVLYSEVFTQYGPFHSQAWELALRCLGGIVNHNHVGAGVLVLWLGTVTLLTTWIWTMTRSPWWAAGGAVITTWSSQGLAAELGHPMSLCLFLLSMTAVAFLPAEGRKGALLGFLGGLSLAALAFTKINLGLFACTAVGLVLLLGWTAGGLLSAIATFSAILLPFVLLSSVWPLDSRMLLGFGTCIPTVMLFRIWRSTFPEPLPWQRNAALWSSGFIVGTLLIMSVSFYQGVDLADLKAGMIDRPLQLSSQFSASAKIVPWDVISLTMGSILIIVWQFNVLRSKELFWNVTTWVVSLLSLSGIWFGGQIWSAGSGALLWLPATLLDHRKPSHARALFGVILLATWQSLSVFPVFGTQYSVPQTLAGIVWTVSLAFSTQKVAAHLGRWRICFVGITALHFATSLAFILENRHRDTIERIRTHVRSPLAGSSWYHMPMPQFATFGSIVANIGQVDGPLFTFHGQNSFPLWAEKPFVNGFNCTHITGILRESELQATLERYRQHISWSALILSNGIAFGKGPYFKLVESFVSESTDPWLTMGNYQLRVSHGQALPRPVLAAWRDGNIWKISAPVLALKKARKWRLRLVKQIGSGRWSIPVSETSESQGEYGESALPFEVVNCLEKLQPEDLKNCTLWLYDMKWRLLVGVPVVQIKSYPTSS